MKSFITSLMSAMLVGGIVLFNACSQDEAEVQTLSKAEMLKAKAKEFAKKYGVSMSLNEENLSQLAETLTVEQMEKDFQAFAALKGQNIVCGESVTKADASKRTNKLKIRRSKTVEEEREYDYSGSTTLPVSGSSTKRNKDGELENFSFSGSADVSWQYTLKKSSHVRVSMDMVVNGMESCSSSATLSHTSFDTNPSFNFVASGNMSLSTNFYTFNCHVLVCYNSVGKSSITIS